MLSVLPGAENTDQIWFSKLPVYGYNLQIFREDGSICEQMKRDCSCDYSTRCHQDVYIDRLKGDDRFVSTYFTLFKDPLVYSSYDWAN